MSYANLVSRVFWQFKDSAFFSARFFNDGSVDFQRRNLIQITFKCFWRIRLKLRRCQQSSLSVAWLGFLSNDDWIGGDFFYLFGAFKDLCFLSKIGGFKDLSEVQIDTKMLMYFVSISKRFLMNKTFATIASH